MSPHRDPDDDPAYDAAYQLLRTRMHPAVAAILADQYAHLGQTPRPERWKATI